MSLLARHNGSFLPPKDVFTKVGGVWVPAQAVYMRTGGVWTEIYTAEVVVTLSNSENVVAQNLFTPEVWASTKRKRVIIPPGVTIGSLTSTPAMRTGTGWGGELIIENHGAIQGRAGLANSGVGGNAFQADAAGVILLNFGGIWAGGGGGGKGGTGGNGSYTDRQPSSGWNFTQSAPLYMWMVSSGIGADTLHVRWNQSGEDTVFSSTSNIYRTSVTVGSWTYLRGPLVQSGDTTLYRVARQRTLSSTGGSGGNGGHGQGYTLSRQSGSAGSSGGTNAGNGGTGGLGGLWGESGGTGAAGQNGNASNGSAGVVGGLAGFALVNAAFITLENTGSILGRT